MNDVPEIAMEAGTNPVTSAFTPNRPENASQATSVSFPPSTGVGRVGIDTRPLRELALHLLEAERRDGGAPDAPGGLLRALLFGRGRIGAAWVMRWAPSSTPSKSRETPEGVPCRVSEGFVMKLSTASTGRAAA